MKTSDVTFAELRDFLVGLEFSETREKTRLRFVHPNGSVLLFRLYDRDERVNARDILALRRQLVYSGLIEDADLDAFLQKASA